MLKRLYNHLKTVGKPLTVHTEMIIDDEVWEKIKKKALNNEVYQWYIITPYNFDIFQSFFRLRMDKDEFEQKLIERYKWLINNDQSLQLHLHLSKNMKNMTRTEQRGLIIKSIGWIEEKLQIGVSEMVPGWWSYNQDTEYILNELNIKLIKRFEYKDCHDYDWIDLK